MKTLARVAVTILVSLVSVLIILRITGFNPIGDTPGPGNYPGLWLSGEVVTTPVTDWSFASQYRTDKLQTRTPYLIPHSVTTGFVVHNGQLYITSNFGAGVPFPQGKSWVANVVRDPHVRLKLGNNLYDCVLTPVTDPDERSAVLGPRAKQNPPPAGSNATSGPVMHLFHAASDPTGR
jgi:hypothetical protein